MSGILVDVQRHSTIVHRQRRTGGLQQRSLRVCGVREIGTDGVMDGGIMGRNHDQCRVRLMDARQIAHGLQGLSFVVVDDVAGNPHLGTLLGNGLRLPHRVPHEQLIFAGTQRHVHHYGSWRVARQGRKHDAAIIKQVKTLGETAIGLFVKLERLPLDCSVRYL